MKTSLKILSIALLVSAWSAQHSVCAAETSGATTNLLTLQSVIGEVLSNHPALKAARAGVNAMEARVPQERAWADPRVGVDAERADSVNFTGFNDLEWMVSQEIPISGKNRQRARAATAEAGAASAELRRRAVELVSRARVAYFRYGNARVQLDLNSRTDALLTQFRDVSLEKFRAGTRMQADVLLAETELAKNSEARRDLERQLSEAQSQLNVVMNRSPQSPLGTPEQFSPRPPQFDLLKMQSMALAHRPELEAAKKRIEASQIRVDLAKRAWIPDPEIRVEARQFSRGGFQEYDTGIFFSFPWFNRGKYRGAINEARSTLEGTQHELEALETETLGMVRDQLKKIETFHHHHQLFSERILPLARQTVEATRLAYANEKGSFLELINALRTVQDSEATLHNHLTDYFIAVAELSVMLGSPADDKAAFASQTSTP